jgi:hypothetical protein
LGKDEENRFSEEESTGKNGCLMYQDTSKKSIRQNIQVLARGDSQMETDLAVLCYQSIQELREKYAEALTRQDAETIRFIRHKYRYTFALLALPELRAAVDRGCQIMETCDGLRAIENSVASVGALCELVIEQLSLAYPGLAQSVK